MTNCCREGADVEISLLIVFRNAAIADDFLNPRISSYEHVTPNECGCLMYFFTPKKNAKSNLQRSIMTLYLSTYHIIAPCNVPPNPGDNVSKNVRLSQDCKLS